LPGRTPAEAVAAFVTPLQRAISCVTDAVLTVGGGYTPGDVHALSLAQGEPVQLNRDPPLALRAIQHYRIVEAADARGPWKAQTVAYWYAIETLDEREVLAYHWHPNSRSATTAPHLHLGPAAQVGFERLSDSHLPTGRIALEDVLRLAIRDLGVRARRNDWEETLDLAQDAY